MYFYFLINNLHFALELFGFVVFLMAAWLTLDSYFTQKDFSTLFRGIGFGLIGASVLVHALNYGSDILSYLGSFLFVLGLTLMIAGFLLIKKLQMASVLVIPAFSTWDSLFSGLSTALLALVVYFAYRQYKREYNPTWIPLIISFLLITLGSLFSLFNISDQVNIVFIVSHFFELLGYGFLARWVWQYLSLRIRESMVLIFISGALFLATVVTLAFSTILIGRIAVDTEASLLTDAKVFDLTINSLENESLAKARLLAGDSELIQALSKNDFSQIERIIEGFLEKEKVGFITVADKDGNVILRAHALTKRGDSISNQRVFEEAVSGNPFVTIENDLVEKLSVRAGARIVGDGNTLGVLVVGYPLDNAMVDGIKRITGLEMLVYDKDVSVAGTALAVDGRTRLIGTSVTSDNIKNIVLNEGKSMTARVTMSSESFLASYLPLYNGDGKIIGMVSAAKSEQNILDIANATNRLTLITIIIMMLVLAWPIYSFTKKLLGGV